MSKAQEYMEQTVQRLIQSIEQGIVDGKWTKPWVGGNDGMYVPTNALTKKAYSGGNFIALMMFGWDKGYRTGEWATYKQWTELGAQVRKGEKSTMAIKWNQLPCKDHGPAERCTSCGRMIPNVFFLFNAEQVDGWELPEPLAESHVNPDSRSAHLDGFFDGLGARITTSANACYVPTADEIRMPEFAAFKDATYFYSTLAHEVIHWTGHESRLNRGSNTKWDSDAYAFEELVAELGATMLCVQLGIEDQPREDHAQYLKAWVQRLNNDYKSLWTAASLASKAAEYVMVNAKQPIAG